jgi:hypothetical protein
MNSRVAGGILLLAVSIPPLFLMFREMAIGAGVRAQYLVDDPPVVDKRGRPLETASLDIGAHRVELLDDQPVKVHEPFKADQDLSEVGKVQIVIDGKPYAQPAVTRIRLLDRGVNRFWGVITLFTVSESGGSSRAVVAQNLGDNKFRTVSVFADGRIVEDRFEYGDRCHPSIRAALIRPVASHPIGFCSDVMTVYPSIAFPLAYPFLSGVAGLGLTILGLRGRLRREQSAV